MALHNQLGNDGEFVAFRYIEKKLHLQILEKNWSFQKKEIDLIATDGVRLIVFEVKTRTSSTLIPPIMAVNKKKQEFLIAAVNSYIRIKRLSLPVQFDVISVIYHPVERSFEVEHIPNAFYPALKRAQKKYKY